MPTVATGITEPSGSMKDGYAAAGVGDDHDDHVDVDIDHHHNHHVDDHDERESNVMKAVMDERMGVARRNISSTEIRHQPGVKGG